MAIDTQRSGFRCRKCNTPFFAEMVVNVPIDVWVAHLGTIKCPSCRAGKKHLSLGMDLSTAEDEARRVDGPLEFRANHWREHGETGMSSETIYRFFMHGDRSRASTPSDPSDFRRCHLLLERVPEWRGRMREMAVIPGWERLALEWERVTALLLEEAPNLTGAAPATYALIKELTDIPRQSAA